MPARMLALAAVIALVGCAGEPLLPPPGAQGPILVRQWDARGERQVVVKARSIHPTSGDPSAALDEMSLETVLVRAPFANGVVYGSAPSGRFTKAGERVFELPEPGGPASGAVQLAGVLRGSPATGRAARAWLRQSDQALIFEDVELVEMAKGGSLTTSPQVVVRQGEQMELVGRTRHERAPAGVIAALAGLPKPLVLPELTAE
jgi:hypothetical protein